MKALVKALAMLNAFAKQDEPLGVSEISELLGLKRSMVSKVLSTFRDANLLEQHPGTRKYTPAIGCYLLGQTYINRLDIAQVGAPVLRRVVDDTGHSAVISILHDQEVLHLLAMEGRLFLDARWRVGETLPFHASAAGRVLLAFEADEVVSAIIKAKGMPRLTARTICDPAAFGRKLQQVRQTGIAATRGESLPGLGALAVPVFNSQEKVVASLALIFPDRLVEQKDEPRLAGILHDAARQFSSRLGASLYPFDGKADAPLGRRQGTAPAKAKRSVRRT